MNTQAKQNEEQVSCSSQLLDPDNSFHRKRVHDLMLNVSRLAARHTKSRLFRFGFSIEAEDVAQEAVLRFYREDLQGRRVYFRGDGIYQVMKKDGSIFYPLEQHINKRSESAVLDFYRKRLKIERDKYLYFSESESNNAGVHDTLFREETTSRNQPSPQLHIEMTFDSPQELLECQEIAFAINQARNSAFEQTRDARVPKGVSVSDSALHVGIQLGFYGDLGLDRKFDHIIESFTALALDNESSVENSMILNQFRNFDEPENYSHESRCNVLHLSMSNTTGSRVDSKHRDFFIESLISLLK